MVIGILMRATTFPSLARYRDLSSKSRILKVNRRRSWLGRIIGYELWVIYAHAKSGAMLLQQRSEEALIYSGSLCQIIILLPISG